MKRFIKPFVSIILVLCIVLSFAACGSEGLSTINTKISKDDYSLENNVNCWSLGNVKDNSVFDTAQNKIDLDSIYSSIEYDESMLRGVYSLSDEKKDAKKFAKQHPAQTVSFYNGDFDIAKFPVSASIGADYLVGKNSTFGRGYYALSQFDDKNFAVLEFLVGDETGSVPCVYEVKDNKIIFQAIEITSEKDAEKCTYVKDTPVFEYEFTLKGPYLTLTSGDESITLLAFGFTNNNESDNLTLSGYLIPDSASIDGLDHFSTLADIAYKRNGDIYESIGIKICDNGSLTMYLKEYDDEEVFCKQFAYLAHSTGYSHLSTTQLTLFDGEHFYRYSDSAVTREKRIGNSEGLDENQIKEIAEKKSDLFDDLYTEFKNNGIKATIDRTTGEIALDTNVVFSGNSATITADGGKLIKDFEKSLSSILSNEKYDGFISKVLVEGHIAPVGNTTYEGGLPLSTQRADNVKKFMLKNTSNKKLASMLKSKGYSQSKPVYADDGEIDYNACRRVSFRFVVNVQK